MTLLKTHIACIVLYLFTMVSYAQLSKTTNKYLTFGIGYNAVNFIDFSTSPLLYKGGTFVVILGYEDYLGPWYTNINLGVATTNFTSQSIPLLEIKNEGTVFAKSDLIKYGVTFSMLRQIRLRKKTPYKFNIYAGGMLDMTSLIRKNQNLFNNKIGAEVFSSLFASASILYAYKRTSENKWIKTFLPKNGALTYRLDLPLIYANYRRTNYINISDATIRNKAEKVNLYKELNFYKGFHMKSSLGYNIYLGQQKSNIIRLSYQWHLYTISEGNYSKAFDYAGHTFLCTFLFNLN